MHLAKDTLAEAEFSMTCRRKPRVLQLILSYSSTTSSDSGWALA